jgi:hypothetical protein
MEHFRIIAIAVAIFLLLNLLFYRTLKGYVTEAYGKKWLTIWGNKLYFWQSMIFMSTAGTALIVYVLKWSNVLAF